jgi:hypothetical protein
MSNNLEADEKDGLLSVALSRAYSERDKIDVWDDDKLREFRKNYPHADVVPMAMFESLLAERDALLQFLRSVVYRLNGASDSCSLAIMDECGTFLDAARAKEPKC